MSSSKIWCRPLPASLAAYIATSACRISSSLSPAPAGVHDDPDARADRELTPCDRDRLGELLEQSIGHGHGAGRVGAFEQQHELVATEPGQRVGRPRDGGEPRGHVAKQLVARIMTEAVVHLLEAVQVDEQHGQDVTGPRRPGQRLIEPIAEQRAVREAGEAVVEGLVGELLLEPHSLGHVSGVEDHAADVAVAAEIADVRLEDPLFAEPVDHPEHELVRLAVLTRRPNDGNGRRRGRTTGTRRRGHPRWNVRASPSRTRSRTGIRPRRTRGRGRWTS